MTARSADSPQDVRKRSLPINNSQRRPTESFRTSAESLTAFRQAERLPGLSSQPFSVNPLAPEPGYPVQAHIRMVRALFLAAFDANKPSPQIMPQALGAGGTPTETGVHARALR